VSSRFWIGLGAWVLGAVTATAGSMIAVSQLAHGLLAAQAQQLGGTTVSADLDPGSSSADPSSAAPTARVSRPAVRVTPLAVPSAAASQPPADSPGGTLLVSADGSVMATCQPDGAYLLYWSPDQGFQVPADDVHRGPAGVTSVFFRGQTGSLVMRVTCSGGTPIARVYRATDGGDGGDGGGD
jgi:hypothetical protein